MIKPSRLQRGDTIGLVSPSSGVAGLAPHRFEIGVKNLEQLGLKIKVGTHARTVAGWTAGTAEQRADDLNAMFADTDVKAIMCCIGGFHANQIVRLLDYPMIEKNPKIFIGFSDISVLHFALHAQANLVTFYGPALLTQFGEPFGVNSYTLEMFLRALTNNDPIGRVAASTEWTDEVLNWFQKKDLERPRMMKPNAGHIWLVPGSCQGVLVGGCITSILHLRGTEFWPKTDGRIFFWEIPESDSDMKKGESVARVDAFLTDLELSKTFDQITGMIIGRPKGYSDEDEQLLRKVILSHMKSYEIPILYNVDIGHTDPIMTLPLGVEAKLDSKTNTFSIVESAVL
jgi:muramoyltetrapeptide carboxypeptidase